MIKKECYIFHLFDISGQYNIDKSRNWDSDTTYRFLFLGSLVVVIHVVQN